MRHPRRQQWNRCRRTDDRDRARATGVSSHARNPSLTWRITRNCLDLHARERPIDDAGAVTSPSQVAGQLASSSVASSVLVVVVVVFVVLLLTGGTELKSPRRVSTRGESRRGNVGQRRGTKRMVSEG